jgi:hypothetical protein
MTIPYSPNVKNVENKTPIVAQAQSSIYSSRLYPPEAEIPDQFYWLRPPGNLALTLTGKFNSAEKMAKTFNLSKKIGSFDGREWKLSDILLAVDFGGGGYYAQWQVSGPKPLIQNYLNALKAQYDNKSVFYDFSYSTIHFTVSGY